MGGLFLEIYMPGLVTMVIEVVAYGFWRDPGSWSYV